MLLYLVTKDRLNKPVYDIEKKLRGNIIREYSAIKGK